MSRRVCVDCGAVYYKTNNRDVGICDACTSSVADALIAANARRRREQHGDGGRPQDRPSSPPHRGKAT